jgi:hypothetical protein
MRRLIGLAAAAILGTVVFASSLPVNADSASDLQTQLTAAYQNQCKLFEASNMDDFAKTLTPDFVGTDPEGKKETRDQTMADMKAVLDGIEITACHFTFTNVQMIGGYAVATLTASFDGTAQGSAPLYVVSRSTDTWTEINGVWLEKASTTLEQTVTVSGKVVQHSGNPPASPAP